MNNLIQAIEPILERIQRYRARYEQNETEVRVGLVNPALRILGWNPENPEEVRHNESIEGRLIPDYSLIKDGRVMLFIEAKNLGVDIGRREVIHQLAHYSFNEGKKYGLLTNGAVWILIKSFEEGTRLTERVIWKADLENEALPAVVKKLMTISKPNIEQVETLVKRAQILDKVWQALQEKPEEIVKGLTPVVKLLISEMYPEDQFDDEEVEDFLRERIKEKSFGLLRGEQTEIPEELLGRNSRRMQLQGKTFEILHSYDILVNTANWLIEKGKLTDADCPIIIGRAARYLIHKEPKHRNGDEFGNPKQLSNGLHIHTSFGDSQTINQAKRLLEKYRYSANILVIN